MKDMMIDIETLALRNDAAVLSVGMVMFTETKILQGLEILIDPIWSPGYRDQANHEFWDSSNVTPETYHHNFSGVIPGWEAGAEIVDFITQHQPEYVWANPSAFDHTILEAWLPQVGFEVPWSYKQRRDMYTVIGIAESMGIAWRGIAEADHIASGQEHGALADAIAQVKTLQFVLKALNWLPWLRTPN